MSGLVLRGGAVVDPRTGAVEPRDVVVRGTRVEALVAPGAAAPGAEALDVSGLHVCPGFIDLRGSLDADDDRLDALAGGFTTVLAAGRAGAAVPRAVRCASLFDGQGLGALEAGTTVLSSGYQAPPSLGVLRRALLYWRDTGVPLLVHAEDASLTLRGVLGAGATAAGLGLLPVPEAAEAAAVAGIIEVLEECGGALHLNHLSCAGSLRLVREAKARGLKLTADAAIAHACADDTLARGYAQAARIWPPLRPAKHRAAVVEALRDGTLDAVSSDHRPVQAVDREHTFDANAPGGRSARDVFGRLCSLGLPLARVIALLTSGPAAIARLEAGALGAGALADLTVVDAAKGQVRYTLVNGMVHHRGQQA